MYDLSSRYSLFITGIAGGGSIFGASMGLQFEVAGIKALVSKFTLTPKKQIYNNIAIKMPLVFIGVLSIFLS